MSWSGMRYQEGEGSSTAESEMDGLDSTLLRNWYRERNSAFLKCGSSYGSLGTRYIRVEVTLKE